MWTIILLMDEQQQQQHALRLDEVMKKLEEHTTAKNNFLLLLVKEFIQPGNQRQETLFLEMCKHTEQTRLLCHELRRLSSLQ